MGRATCKRDVYRNVNQQIWREGITLGIGEENGLLTH